MLRDQRGIALFLFAFLLAACAANKEIVVITGALPPMMAHLDNETRRELATLLQGTQWSGFAVENLEWVIAATLHDGSGAQHFSSDSVLVGTGPCYQCAEATATPMGGECSALRLTAWFSDAPARRTFLRGTYCLRRDMLRSGWYWHAREQEVTAP